MKLKHIGLLTGLVIIIAVGFIIYRVVGSLDQIIEAGIETYGTEITQAEVSLAGVTLDLAGGQLALNGLHVGNPAGFQTEYLIKLDEIKVTLDIDSLTKNPIIVKEILVQNPSVIYEMAAGGSNVDALLKNIESYTGNQEAKPDGGDEGPKLVIDDVYIKNGEVNLSHTALEGKKISTGLPDIHLEDIGKEEGGASPGEVAEKIMGEIKSGATTAVGSIKNLPGAVAEQLGNVGSTVREKLGAAGEKLKGLFQ